ncbi:RNA polymerase sigma factor SigX [Thalassobacillus sp. CUG 92003]|uniref:RNA polymerase sigma factor SigX n=1 Tax=Thalassobacillus sp. CUG 92003 TaxID=2736641 RepID=UPI0015E6512F|nr:RNA polymerase sigma factor SigX [Thalassobacillus sp. CUG 92003]
MKAVFERLYDHYHRDVFQFILYMVKNRDLAEDLVQDVYIKVMKSYDSFNGKSSEKTWLFSIARHVTIDHFRKQKRTRERIMEFFDWGEQGERLKDNEPLPEEITIQKEEMKKVYRGLDYCTVNQKSVIILRFIQSMSIEETAAILGWSESKVKTTQHRGMKALKEQLEKLEEEGIEHEA